jgi:MtN3 and saliva related transmembrane protein
MQIATLVGAFAAICSTVSFAPQAWKVIRTRSTKDISTGMYLFAVAAFAGWIGYGIMLGQCRLSYPMRSASRFRRSFWL